MRSNDKFIIVKNIIEFYTGLSGQIYITVLGK